MNKEKMDLVEIPHLDGLGDFLGSPFLRAWRFSCFSLDALDAS